MLAQGRVPVPLLSGMDLLVVLLCCHCVGGGGGDCGGGGAPPHGPLPCQSMRIARREIDGLLDSALEFASLYRAFQAQATRTIRSYVEVRVC